MGLNKKWIILSVAICCIIAILFIFNNRSGDVEEKEESTSTDEPVISYEEKKQNESMKIIEDADEDNTEEVSIDDIEKELEELKEDQEIANENALIDYEDDEPFIDYNQQYIDTFGEKAFEESRRIAYEKMMLLLQGDFALSKWEDDVTSTFMDEVKEYKRVGRKTDRPINSIELLPAEPKNDAQITIGILADTTDSTTFWHMTFEVDQNKVFIDHLDLVWER